MGREGGSVGSCGWRGGSVGAVDRMGVWGLWIERHEKVKGVVTL